VTNVCGRNNDLVRSIAKREGLGGQNDIAVKGMTICGWPTRLANFGLEFGGATHDRCVESKVVEFGLQCVQDSDAVG